ncbi:MAG TPA: hypothetical protein VKE69_10850, partial [Planctomycetota bacterium]|nr:hypothetical protein [Planctomycetota bacterium]
PTLVQMLSRSGRVLASGIVTVGGDGEETTAAFTVPDDPADEEPVETDDRRMRHEYFDVGRP